MSNFKERTTILRNKFKWNLYNNILTLTVATYMCACDRLTWALRIRRVCRMAKKHAPQILFPIFLPLEQRKSILRLKKRQETTADVAQGMQIKQE